MICSHEAIDCVYLFLDKPTSVCHYILKGIHDTVNIAILLDKVQEVYQMSQDG